MRTDANGTRKKDLHAQALLFTSVLAGRAEKDKIVAAEDEQESALKIARIRPAIRRSRR